MKFGRFGVGLAAAIAIAFGCSDDPTGGSTTSSNANESWADVHPPDNIDIVSCPSIITDGTTVSLEACIGCCAAVSQPLSSFINQGQCTCAETIPPRAELCAAKTANSQVCDACCQAAGYTLNGISSEVPPVCICDVLVDKASCQNTVTRSEPADQCALCCLNHGFINAEYTAAGEPECACS